MLINEDDANLPGALETYTVFNAQYEKTKTKKKPPKKQKPTPPPPPPSPECCVAKRGYPSFRWTTGYNRCCRPTANFPSMLVANVYLPNGNYCCADGSTADNSIDCVSGLQA